MLAKSDKDVHAMEAETEGFRVSRQVPALWLYVVSCFTFLSLLIAIVAIALGAAAVTKSDDNKSTLDTLEALMEVVETSPTPLGQPVQPQGEPSVQLQQSQTESPSVATDVDQQTLDLRSTPGKNFSDNKVPNNPFRERVFSVVVHGLDTDTFWYTVQQGIADAADFFRVHFNYDNPSNADEHLDFQKMAEDIKKARFNLQDGLAVSIQVDEALDEAIRIAAEEIPVLSINSGEDLFASLGAFTHIGQPEFEAGRRAGLKMRDLGITRAICLKHEDSLSLDRRCRGFEEGLGNDASIQTVTAIKGQDADDITQLLSDTLSDDSDFQGLLTLGPSGFLPARELLGREGRVCAGERTRENSDCLEFGTFDVSREILEAIVAGELSFGIDQQEYLQGYLAITFLALRSMFGVTAGTGNAVLSGPIFVETAEDAQSLLLRNYTNGTTFNGKDPHELDIRYITHGKPQDKFWRAVRFGVKYASNKYGLTMDYREPQNEFTEDETLGFMRDRLRQAIDDGVDGVVISIPRNDTPLRVLIEEAIEKRIPIVAVNVGADLYESYGVPLFVGHTNFFSGRQTGKRLAEAGVNKAICLVHDNPNLELDAICNGLLEGLQMVNVDAEMLRLNGTLEGTTMFEDDLPNRPIIMQEAIVGAIGNDSTINAVVALGPAGTDPAVKAIDSLDKHCTDERTPNGTRDCIAVAAFDVSVPTLDLIEEERVSFVVDDQQILQGILPVMFLTLQNLWGNMPVGIVNTGPDFVDVTNVGIFEFFA